MLGKCLACCSLFSGPIYRSDKELNVPVTAKETAGNWYFQQNSFTEPRHLYQLKFNFLSRSLTKAEPDSNKVNKMEKPGARIRGTAKDKNQVLDTPTLQKKTYNCTCLCLFLCVSYQDLSQPKRKGTQGWSKELQPADTHPSNSESKCSHHQIKCLLNSLEDISALVWSVQNVHSNPVKVHHLSRFSCLYGISSAPRKRGSQLFQYRAPFS